MLLPVTSHTTYSTRADTYPLLFSGKKYMLATVLLWGILFLAADTSWSVGILMLGHSEKVDIKHLIGLEAHIQYPKQCTLLQCLSTNNCKHL